MNFSERMGFVVPKTILQKETMDIDLQNCLWNAFYAFCAEPYNFFYTDYLTPVESDWENFFMDLWCLFLKKPLDDLSLGRFGTFFVKLKNIFYEFKFYKVYDFIEYVSKNIPYKKREFTAKCNEILERERSAYRFTNKQLAPITSEIEINEIKTALSNTDKFFTTSEHINKTLEHFSNKINPDYRNSIKESISAV